MWCLCEWWVDANHDAIEVEDPDDIRANCIGLDSSRNRFWYFGDLRLYQETRTLKRPIENGHTESTQKAKLSSPSPQNFSESKTEPLIVDTPLPITETESALSTSSDIITQNASEDLGTLKPSAKVRVSQRHEVPLDIDPKLEDSLFSPHPVSISSPFTTRRPIKKVKTQALVEPMNSRRSSRILVNEALKNSLSDLKETPPKKKAKTKSRKTSEEIALSESDPQDSNDDVIFMTSKGFSKTNDTLT